MYYWLTKRAHSNKIQSINFPQGISPRMPRSRSSQWKIFSERKKQPPQTISNNPWRNYDVEQIWWWNWDGNGWTKKLNSSYPRWAARVSARRCGRGARTSHGCPALRRLLVEGLLLLIGCGEVNVVLTDVRVRVPVLGWVIAVHLDAVLPFGRKVGGHLETFMNHRASINGSHRQSSHPAGMHSSVYSCISQVSLYKNKSVSLITVIISELASALSPINHTGLY